MRTAQKVKNNLRDTIMRYSNMGRDFIYNGFRYYTDDKGTVCCALCANTESDTVELLDGVQKVTFWKEWASSNTVKFVLHTKHLILPESLNRIGRGAFIGSAIGKISFGGTRVIESYAFAGCKLGNMSLPDTIRTIGEGAFRHTDVQAVSLGSGISTINAGIFYSSGISYISMSRCLKVKKIHSSAFSECTRLEHIDFPPYLTELDTAAFSNTGFESIDLSTYDIDIMPKECFAYSEKLKRIELPYNCKRVCQDAFFGCDNLQVLQTSRRTAFEPGVRAWLEDQDEKPYRVSIFFYA